MREATKRIVRCEVVYRLVRYQRRVIMESPSQPHLVELWLEALPVPPLVPESGPGVIRGRRSCKSRASVCGAVTRSTGGTSLVDLEVSARGSSQCLPSLVVNSPIPERLHSGKNRVRQRSESQTIQLHLGRSRSKAPVDFKDVGGSVNVRSSALSVETGNRNDRIEEWIQRIVNACLEYYDLDSRRL